MINQADSTKNFHDADGLANRLQLIIAQSGLNQAEFAKRLGVSAGFVSEAVRGNKKPGADFLRAVRTEFGASIDWLLTGEGTMHGRSGIDLDLLRAIRLQIAVARTAIMENDPTAKALLLLINDGKLQEATAEPTLKIFLDRIAPEDSDFNLATELYNGHLWTKDPESQHRNLLAAAVAHFEARKPIDKLATLARASGSIVQVNLGISQRNAGRDYYE